jgi:tetratricopeptide (TPR) repeat protein
MNDTTSGDINVTETSGSGIAIGHDAQARNIHVEPGGTYIESHQPPDTRRLHQLRPPTPDFVGRAQQIAQLTQTLTSSSSNGTTAAISGIRGMGGLGKTELAYVVAHRLRDHFPDAHIVLTMFGATSTPKRAEAALQDVIRAFDPTAQLPDDLAALEPLYRATLHGKRVLILADDARDAAQVRPLLPPAGCALLITTRHRFHLRGMQRLDLDRLSAEEAVELLCRICPRIGDHAPALAELCGCLPLALEISAGMLADDEPLTLPRYLEMLQQARLAALHMPDTEADDPQASVEASLHLSYTALPPAAQHALHALSVFVGSFDADALAAVLADIPDAQEQASMLHRRSMLEYDAASERYDLHELVRVFALARLEADAATAHTTRLRHAHHYAAVANQAKDLSHAGHEHLLQGLALFDRERQQIDAAWEWLRSGAGIMENAEWRMQNVGQGAADGGQGAADGGQGAADGGQAEREVDELLLTFADATVYIGALRYDLRGARIPQLQAQLAAAQRLGRKGAEGMALNNLGNAYADLGQVQQAMDYYEQHLAIARDIGDRRGEGNALGSLGLAYADLGQVQQAMDYYEQALTIARAIGDRAGDARHSWNLGLLYEKQGELARAAALMQVDVDYKYEIGHADAEKDAERVEEIRQRLGG